MRQHVVGGADGLGIVGQHASELLGPLTGSSVPSHIPLRRITQNMVTTAVTKLGMGALHLEQRPTS